MKYNKTRILGIIILIEALLIAFLELKSVYTSSVEAKLEKPILEELVPKLKIYTAYDQNGLLKFIRHGNTNDGGYVVPEIALSKADVLLGYGIADDILFEEQFSEKYNKPSYGFDCGVKSIKVKNPLCNFVSECIASDKSIYFWQKSSNKFSSFTEQLQKLNLFDKKLFIKMDIEGGEQEAFEDIYKYGSNITAIVIEIHLWDLEHTIKANDLLSNLSKDFLLVHLHGNNGLGVDRDFTTSQSKGNIPRVLELTFINKSLVTKYEIANDQSHPCSLDAPNNRYAKDSEFEILKESK